MKLEVRMLYENGERPALMLTDEQGEMLPGQRAAMLDTAPGERPMLHVSFLIDGEAVAMALNKQAVQPLQQQKPPSAPQQGTRRQPWWRW